MVYTFLLVLCSTGLAEHMGCKSTLRLQGIHTCALHTSPGVSCEHVEGALMHGALGQRSKQPLLLPKKLVFSQAQSDWKAVLGSVGTGSMLETAFHPRDFRLHVPF